MTARPGVESPVYVHSLCPRVHEKCVYCPSRLIPTLQRSPGNRPPGVLASVVSGSVRQYVSSSSMTSFNFFLKTSYYYRVNKRVFNVSNLGDKGGTWPG